MILLKAATLVIAASVALLPTPVGAKGLEQTLTIVSGPGLDRALILEREHWGIPHNESSPQAVVIEGLVGDSPKASRSPAERLGPLYQIHYQLWVYDLRAERQVLTLVHQRLYPYAEPTPVTYTPPQFWRNPYGPNRIEPGWQRFPVALVERLQRFGLPDRPPALSSPAAAPMAVPVGLTTGAIALALAAVMIRRRDPLLAP